MKNLLKETTRRKLFKNARTQMGLTQAAMSEKLHISERQYGNVERGKNGLTAATLLYFLSALSDEAKLEFLHMVAHEIAEQEDTKE